MEEDNRFKYSNFAEVFGSLQKTHRLRRGCFDYLVIPLLVFFFLAGSSLYYYDTRDWVAIPCCIVPLFLMLASILWHLFSTRRDELRIYDHGFTYRSGKNLQACLWTEIQACHRRERNDRELQDLEPGAIPLSSIEKKSGEIIAFEHDLPGTPALTERFNKQKTKIKR